MTQPASMYFANVARLLAAMEVTDTAGAPVALDGGAEDGAQTILGVRAAAKEALSAVPQIRRVFEPDEFAKLGLPKRSKDARAPERAQGTGQTPPGPMRCRSPVRRRRHRRRWPACIAHGWQTSAARAA